MISVGTCALAHHLGINLSSASLSVFKFLKNQTARTLGHDKSVAACAERAACVLRIVVACRKGLHGIEAANSTSAYGSLGTTTHNHVGLAQTNQIESIGKGVA